jgi:hypothetical protein
VAIYDGRGRNVDLDQASQQESRLGLGVRDQADLDRFLRSAAHVRVMREFRDKGEIAGISWLESSFDPSSVWASAAAALTSGHRRTEQARAAA